jgi:hypothetical protein
MNVALHKHGCDIRVEPNSKQHGGKIEGLLTDDAWGVCDCEGVEVNDSVKDVSVVLA